VAKAEPTPPRVAPPAPEQPTVKAAPPAPAAPPIAAPSLPPAAQALASQAEQQRQSGDYAGAAASLERSLRIAPREAYLWNRLARIRMEQGQGSQAGNLAARSNDLAGANAVVKKDNWRIIAESKRRAGDTSGAAEADRRAGVD
jgi:Tfp pilus assembly protein PilF